MIGGEDDWEEILELLDLFLQKLQSDIGYKTWRMIRKREG